MTKGSPMALSISRASNGRRATAAGVAVAATAAAALAVVSLTGSSASPALPKSALERLAPIQGEPGEEAFEARTAAEQYAQARTAPGIVQPGAYTAAFGQLSALSTTGGSWANTTKLKYNSDDPRYRDWNSNTGAGLGLTTGRVTGLAADGAGNVYAGGADGGVFRSTQGGGDWTAISDGIPSLSTGDLQIGPNGWLWFGTGESNTGATSYVGTGVYALADPAAGSSKFAQSHLVGGTELESTTISALRFTPDGKTVFAATSSGIWTHSATIKTGAWTRVFAPNPTFLAGSGSADANTANAPYKNIVNSIQIDPKNAAHVIAGVGWRGGDAYNGFYETLNGGATWAKVNLKGGVDSIDSTDIGQTSLAYSQDGTKLYALVQSMKLYNKFTGNVSSYLKGVYVSNSGTVAGPWTRIADSRKLANSGSALKQSVGGKGYGPGIQAWYNQFLAVDPADPNHVYVGLEEVYETRNGGSTWKTVGPYWNFYFGCWGSDFSDDQLGCNLTTHPDQHAIAFGSRGGKPAVFVGNDGGVYARPVAGKEDREGHALDWTSLNDGSMDVLQYYAVDAGVDPAGGGDAVSGGLQDNGGSILRAKDTEMGSNFGGDGGDVLVNPENGCEIVQEYVYLSLSVTRNCKYQDPSDDSDVDPFDPATSGSIDDAPADPAPRFIAPFAADDANIDTWIAGGNVVWAQTEGFAITSSASWKPLFNLGPGHSSTAVAARDGKAYVGWCGPCNNSGFARGIAVGTTSDPLSWKQVDVSTLPNRYIGGVGIDPDNSQHAYVAFNGFSRKWTEGPGAGVGHVFETTNGGATWANVDGNLPDVPANSIKVTDDGDLVLGTDLGVLYRAEGSANWTRLGGNLPYSSVTDVELSPDRESVYASTHGRGIWKIALP